MIEEVTVSNFNGTDLFLLKGGAKSDDDDISCAINENLHSLSNNQGQDLTPIGNASDLLNTTEPASNPTSSPTSSPTSNPTPSTTSDPTSSPTSSPTSRPTSEPETTTPSSNETIPNYYHRNYKSSGGLSGGAIAAIVISIIVALIALIALIAVFKSNNSTMKKQTVVTIENSSNFENSEVKFKLPKNIN